MKQILIVVLTLCCTVLLSFRLDDGQKATKDSNFQVKWMSFDEAVQKSQAEPKKIMVDLYTNWCTWCTKMDKSTFQHPAIAAYINQNFYPVKLDAETKETISFKNNHYAFKPNEGQTGSGVNEIAVYLTRGRLNYPSVIFLDETMSNPQPVNGFVNPVRMDKLLRYFGENHYKKVDWGLFNQIYRSPLEQQTTSSLNGTR